GTLPLGHLRTLISSTSEVKGSQAKNVAPRLGKRRRGSEVNVATCFVSEYYLNGDNILPWNF
ncbi:MAG: hypothetical protein V3U51_01260, partial [Thermoplasmata archaeon]